MNPKHWLLSYDLFERHHVTAQLIRERSRSICLLYTSPSPRDS